MANPTPRKKNPRRNSINKPKEQIDLPIAENVIMQEEIISGAAAEKMYELLMNPPKDSAREELIKQAVKQFPKPNETTVLDIIL